MVFNATFNNISVISWYANVSTHQYNAATLTYNWASTVVVQKAERGRRGPDPMVVGFPTAYAIIAYYH
jgi:hypothetical protein